MSDEHGLSLWFLESLDRINRAIQGSNDLEQATSDMLEGVLSIFKCDRAWLLHPCDPDAPSWRPVMEHTRPEFPGAFSLGQDMPMDPETAAVFRQATSSPDAVRRGPAPSPPVSAAYAERFHIRSLIAVAVHARGERPYLFGLHQCTHARIWTPGEERLLQEIGRRLGDALTSLLMFRHLRESEGRFRTFVDHATDAFILHDEQLRIVDVNRRACESLGLSRQELIGLHPRDFDVGLDEAAMDRLAERVLGGEVVTFESRHRRKDGTVFPVEVRAACFEQERRRFYLCLVRDITERTRAEAGLLEMSERFRTLAESSLLGVYLIQDGLFQYVNPVLARMFGYTVDELVGRLGPVDLVHPDDRPQVRENVRRRVAGTVEEIRYELRGLRKDGSLFPIEVHGRRVELGGKVGVMGALLDNTERKLAEQELRTSEARFRALIEHAGASFMLFDQKGVVVEVNRMACESLGYAREELLGKTPMDFGVRVTAADMARRRALVNSGETLRFETFHRRKDGSLFPVEVRVRSAGIESGYAIALAQDITERRRNERRVSARQRITQSLAEARTLEEAAPRLLAAIADGLEWDFGELWRIDSERGVLRLVESWDRAAGAAPRFDAASREIPVLRGQGLPGRVWTAEQPLWIPDVAEEPSLLRTEEARALGLHAGLGVPILLGGEVRGVVVLFSTEARTSDPEVLDFLSGIASQIGQFIERKRAEEGLNDARAQITHLTRIMTMGELTAAIAHELKQPLASLAAAAGASRHWLARDPPDLREVEDCLDQVSSDARRAGEVLDRIRSMVARSPPSKTRLDLNETLREVVALSQAEAHRHRVVVRTSLSVDLPAVIGDRVQLQQVVLNLVVNAIHAMTATTDRPRELSMRSTRIGNEVVVEVEDRGVGVKPEELERIFEPFFTTKSDGLGVGLAISRRIIEDHGGRLWATANEGAGTTFRFTIPAEEALGAPADAPGAAHS